MKKFYTILAGMLVVAASATAQNLTFYMDGKPVDAGSTVYFNEIDKEPAGSSKVEVTINPKLSLGTDLYNSSICVTATCTSGQKIQMCAGGTCVSGEVVKKTDLKVQTNAKLDLQFEYIGVLGKDEEIPTVTTKFEAWSDDDEEETLRTFTLVMNGTSALTLVENTKPIEVSAAGLVYNIKGTAKLAVYNALGQVALQRNVNEHGVVSTAGLAPGLYFYTLRGAGVNHSGKVYVR